MNEGEPKPYTELDEHVHEQVDKILFSMGVGGFEPNADGRKPRIEISAEELDAMLWA